MSPAPEENVEDLNSSDQKKMLEHLQAPRKKRKNYVFLAIGRDVDTSISSRIVEYLNLNFPQFTVYRVEKIEDLAKLTTKLTNLLIVSDGFGAFDVTMPVFQDFKKLNGTSPVPILFLTSNEEELILKYKQYLGVYQETDDYLNSHNLLEKHLFAKIYDRLNQKGPLRKARRFPVEISVRYSELDTGTMLKGMIEDMSMYGCLLSKEDDSPHFRKNEQFRIYITNDGYLPLEQGESIVFFGVASRVLLGGQRTGIQWAHLSDEKHASLFKMLTEIQSRRLVSVAIRERNAAQIRAKAKI